MPGTGLLELALAAGQRVGSEVVEELTLQAPLLFTDDGAVELQLTVSEPDPEGRRELEIYSRSQQRPGEELGDGEEWTRHASGVLCAGEGLPDSTVARIRGAVAAVRSPGARQRVLLRPFGGGGLQLRSRVPRSAPGVRGWEMNYSPKSRWTRSAQAKHRPSASIQHCRTPPCTPHC